MLQVKQEKVIQKNCIFLSFAVRTIVKRKQASEDETEKLQGEVMKKNSKSFSSINKTKPGNRNEVE